MTGREKRTKVIDCIETIYKYLDENEKESGETYYTDFDGDTFSTDMGYFYEGLGNMKDYLTEKNQRETETVKYRKYFEGWLYEILNNNFENKEFCKPIEEIISRLNGFERYVANQEAAEQ